VVALVFVVVVVTLGLVGGLPVIAGFGDPLDGNG
jgi:hypothetical protein